MTFKEYIQQIQKVRDEIAKQDRELGDILATMNQEADPPKPAGVIARPGDVLYYRGSLVRVVTSGEFQGVYGHSVPPGRVPFFKGGTFGKYRGIDGNHFSELLTIDGEPITGYEDD